MVKYTYLPIHLSDYFCNSQKWIFEWSGGLNFKNLRGDNELSNKQTVKKLNLWRKTAVNKNLTLYCFNQYCKHCKGFFEKEFENRQSLKKTLALEQELNGNWCDPKL